MTYKLLNSAFFFVNSHKKIKLVIPQNLTKVTSYREQRQNNYSVPSRDTIYTSVNIVYKNRESVVPASNINNAINFSSSITCRPLSKLPDPLTINVFVNTGIHLFKHYSQSLVTKTIAVKHDAPRFLLYLSFLSFKCLFFCLVEATVFDLAACADHIISPHIHAVLLIPFQYAIFQFLPSKTVNCTVQTKDR